MLSGFGWVFRLGFTAPSEVPASGGVCVLFNLLTGDVYTLAIRHCQVDTYCDCIYTGAVPKGRRRKAEAERRTDQILIRVSSREKEELREAARRAGLDLSSWLRSLGYREAAKTRPKAGKGA